MPEDRPDVGVKAHLLFPTPLFTAAVPGAAELCAALRATILAREAATPSVAHSNLGGWQSDTDLEDWGGDAVATLFDFARALATNVTTDRAGEGLVPGWDVYGWANVNRRGDANEFHSHPESVWSGVLYVDDGGCADDEALGGAFEMQDPRGIAPAMFAPTWVPKIPQGESMGATVELRPRAGEVLLFPSWLSHQVRPYLGDGVRISTAFNLKPQRRA